MNHQKMSALNLINTALRESGLCACISSKKRRGERRGREKKKSRRETERERERVERPGGNRTTPLKADHCQPENKRLVAFLVAGIHPEMSVDHMVREETGGHMNKVKAVKSPEHHLHFVVPPRRVLCLCPRHFKAQVQL